MADPATAAVESSTIWVTAASSLALVFGAVGATVVGASIASRALDELDEVDPALMEDEARGGASGGRRRRMTLDEAEAMQQQQAAAAAEQQSAAAAQQPGKKE